MSGNCETCGETICVCGTQNYPEKIIKSLEEKLSAMQQRAEAAEARIKASQEQEPAKMTEVGWAYSMRSGDWHLCKDEPRAYPVRSRVVLQIGSNLYAAPVIPPDGNKK